MLKTYTGPPGSGKTLNAMRNVAETLRRGRNVVSNMEIDLPSDLKKHEKRLHCVENEAITPRFLRDFAEKYHEPRREKQTLVVIDECQLKFSQTFMTKASARPWMEFFSQHRKLGFDFLLVTPSARSGLVRDIRDVVEMEVKHLKMSNYPTKSIFLLLILLLIDLLPIEIFMSIAQWTGLKEKKYLIRRLFLYKPKYGKMYDTFKIYDVTAESKKPTPAPIRAGEKIIAELLAPPDGITWERGGGDTARGGDPPRSRSDPLAGD